MRHLNSGRKLGVSSPHRKAMMRSLTLALIEKDRIRTTPARAKELRRLAERIVTLGKRGDLSARRHMVKLLGSNYTQHPGRNRVRLAMKKVYDDLVPRFKTRNGGYTRIIRIGRRPGDNAEVCFMEFLPAAGKKDAADKGGKAKGAKKEAKAKAPADKGAKKKAKGHDHDHADHKHEAAPADKPVKSAKKKAEPQDKPAKAKKG